MEFPIREILKKCHKMLPSITICNFGKYAKNFVFNNYCRNSLYLLACLLAGLIFVTNSYTIYLAYWKDFKKCIPEEHNRHVMSIFLKMDLRHTCTNGSIP